MVTFLIVSGNSRYLQANTPTFQDFNFLAKNSENLLTDQVYWKLHNNP